MKLQVYLSRKGKISPTSLDLEAPPTASLADIKASLTKSIRLPSVKCVFVKGNLLCPDKIILNDLNSTATSIELYLIINENTINFDKPLLPQLDLKTCQVIAAKVNSVKLRENATANPAPVTTDWECTVCTVVNNIQEKECQVCGEQNPNQTKQLIAVPEQNKTTVECPICTVENPITAKSCSVCSHSFKVDNDVIVRGNEALQEFLEMERQERQAAYDEILSSQNKPYVPNTEKFDCEICLESVEPGEGMMLRSCTHQYCRTCLQDHVKASKHFPIRCPSHTDENPECTGLMEHREVKSVLTEEEFQNFLYRELSAVENTSKNTFHCLTPNCAGFVFFDDDVNKFNCPVCSTENCITCKAQHNPMTCKDHQDDIRRRAARDENARKDLEMLENLLKNGQAMKCPGCTVVLQKKDGCDWMKCSMCQTELCWATRGARWGPNGKGDTSGGCKCRVNGQKCHPQCRNCH